MSRLSDRSVEELDPAVLPALPGEDVDSTDADDARHWTIVYGELLRGIRAMIRADDVHEDDRLQHRAELYARRLVYWRARRLGS